MATSVKAYAVRTLRLPEDLYAELQAVAKEEGVPMARVLRDALRRGLKLRGALKQSIVEKPHNRGQRIPYIADEDDDNPYARL